MAGTGIVIDRRFLEHDTGPGHPERPERVQVLLDLVDERSGDLIPVPARMASVGELALVHDGVHIERVAASENLPHYAFDADTPTSAQSYSVARLAAGGCLSLVDEIIAGRIDNGFAFVRPPGHHAERSRAMGFCLFNNVAVTAAYLRRHHGLEKILVMDWDLHHGNGTQHIFESDPHVLYVSTHQYPYYPGTGAIDETGRGDGRGATVNVPFPAGFGDGEYRDAFHQVIEPVAREFDPDFVLISAGFDCHVRDPLGGMSVTEEGFRFMARRLLAMARDCAGGRCAAILEGGYDLQAIRNSAAVVLDELQGVGPALAEMGADVERAAPLLEQLRETQKRYWKL